MEQSNLKYQASDEVEIDLKELIIYICRRWRSIFVTIVVGAVLLAGAWAVKFVHDGNILTRSPEVIKPALKYAGIGALLALVVICVIYVIRFCFTASLRNTDELKNRFGMFLLGCVYTPVNRSHRCAFDRWLARAEGYPAQVDMDRELAIVAAKLEVLAPEHGRVLITGTVEKEQLDRICQGIQRHMPENTLTVLAIENPMRNADSVHEIQNSQYVLVERIRKSKTYDIQQLLELADACGAKALGAVVQ